MDDPALLAIRYQLSPDTTLYGEAHAEVAADALVAVTGAAGAAGIVANEGRQSTSPGRMTVDTSAPLTSKRDVLDTL